MSEEPKDAVTPDQRLERAWNQIVQFFPDALLIVKPKPSECRWKATDSTWAMAAAQRYVASIEVGDSIVTEDEILKEIDEKE